MAAGTRSSRLAGLQAETTMSLAWIAERLRMSSWSYMPNLLRKAKSAKRGILHANGEICILRMFMWFNNARNGCMS